MTSKNNLIYFSGTLLTTIVFLGCGGGGSETVSMPSISFPKNSPAAPEKKTPSNNGSGHKIRSLGGNPSNGFKAALSRVSSVQTDYIISQQVDELILQNKPVNLTLEYNNIDSSLYHAVLKSDNKIIGENFIWINNSSTKQPIEMLAQQINNQNISKFDVDCKLYPEFEVLWQKSKYSIILDSLKNNLFNNTQNFKYTVNFTLERIKVANFKLSNIQISGLSLTQNEFEFEFFGLMESSLYRQATLATLFANFEKSKEVFN